MADSSMKNDVNSARHTPDVSIVSPVYNCEKYLPQFIDSILRQTLDNWELILVDDGSTDTSADIARDYMKKDPRITCVFSEHCNAGNARNLGLERVRGEYTCFLDSDDFCKPTMLAKMLSAAKTKCADIVLCQTEAYSEKTGEYSRMDWVLNQDLIPWSSDGCFSGKTCSTNLFQCTTLSPWNKLIRTKLLLDNRIRAQSQPAANDVVLSCAALACAERIYPLYEVLYVQRRNNPSSITGRLNTQDKHLCGYTAVVGLLHELKRLGKYEELVDTFQKQAIHSCMWYLSKEMDDLEQLRSDFYFLKNEGISTLELTKISPSVLTWDNPDITAILSVRDDSFEEFLFSRIEYMNSLVSAANEKRDAVFGSIAYKTGRVILTIPRVLFLVGQKCCRGLLSVFNSIAEDLHNRRLRRSPLYRSAPKHIAILAYETFHYDVTSIIIQICNPERNYISAYVHPRVKQELCEAMGTLAGKVEWHILNAPGMGSILQGKVLVKQTRLLFSKTVQKRKDLDYVIVPSAEYYPQWYLPLIDGEHSYTLVVGAHNLNTVFIADEIQPGLKKLYAGADAYCVLLSTLKEYLNRVGINNKPIYVFPPIYTAREKPKSDQNKTRVTFVITGTVERTRKDYQTVVDALKLVPELHSKIRLVLLGRSDNDYARNIVRQLARMETSGLSIVSFSDYVPSSVFSETMDDADYILGPTITSTVNKGVIERYGESKISGVLFDSIRFACPTVMASGMDCPEELEGSVCWYASAEELARLFTDLIRPDVLEYYSRRAKENSEKFLLKHILWDA